MKSFKWFIVSGLLLFMALVLTSNIYFNNLINTSKWKANQDSDNAPAGIPTSVKNDINLSEEVSTLRATVKILVADKAAADKAAADEVVADKVVADKEVSTVTLEENLTSQPRRSPLPVLRTCEPADNLDGSPTSVVMLSMTISPKFMALIRFQVMRWRCSGFKVYLTVLLNPKSDNETLFVGLMKYLNVAESEGLLSFDTITMSDANFAALPGISRYAAASIDQFKGTFVMLADLDLIQLSLSSNYFKQRRNEVVQDFLMEKYTAEAARRDNSTSYNKEVPVPKLWFDLEYPASKECRIEAAKHTTWDKARANKCSRTPRYRTCYAAGYGEAFSHVYRQVAPAGAIFGNTTDVLQHLFTKKVKEMAYPGSGRLDNSYDEILTGKLLTQTEACAEKEKGGGVKWEPSCFRLTTVERDDKAHGYVMLRHKFVTNPGVDKRGVSATIQSLSAAIDIHLGKEAWPASQEPLAAAKQLLDILEEECIAICTYYTKLPGLEKERLMEEDLKRRCKDEYCSTLL